jgi:hypothetical protein
MAKLRKNGGRQVDAGRAHLAFQAGQLRVGFTNFEEDSELILSEEETETLFHFLSSARRRREQALLRQEAIARGEMVVRVQRFVDENGEPRYLVGEEIDASKLDENGMVSVTATTKPVGETDESLLDRVAKLYEPKT